MSLSRQPCHCFSRENDHKSWNLGFKCWDSPSVTKICCATFLRQKHRGSITHSYANLVIKQKNASGTTRKSMRPHWFNCISSGGQYLYVVDKPRKTGATTLAHSALSSFPERVATHLTATPTSTAESQVMFRACVTLLLSASGCSLLNGRCCAPTSPSARGLRQAAMTRPRFRKRQNLHERTHFYMVYQYGLIHALGCTSKY